MKKTTNKNLLYLVAAGLVLLGVNAGVWMGVQNGHLSPIDNPTLWVGFMVLNMVSLLWAVSLLGLQPLVVACSYAAGGFLAYRGVQGLTDISIAEVTTAGATYGAIGALAVGNASTKVRMAFFRKGQVPFIFVIVALLVVDSVLNSQISGAGWTVVLNALVFPFLFAGVIIGLVWMVISRFGLEYKPRIKTDPVVEERAAEPAPDQAAEAPQLMIQVPEAIESEDEPEEIAATLTVPEPEPVLRESPPVEEPPAVPIVEKPRDDHFFPLEIDKDDEFVLPYEDSEPSDLAAVVETPVPDMEPILSLDSIALEMESTLEDAIEPVVQEVEIQEYSVEEAPVVEPELIPEPLEYSVKEDQVAEPDAVIEPVATAPESEDKKPADDWLNGHLDLLNKINTKD